MPEFVESARSPARTAGSSGAVKLNNTHQKMLLGIAMASYGYEPEGPRSDVPARLSADLAELGIEVSDDTIRKHLREATETVQLPPRKSPRWPSNRIRFSENRIRPVAVRRCVTVGSTLLHGATTWIGHPGVPGLPLASFAKRN